jgi:hypothetical protein
VAQDDGSRTIVVEAYGARLRVSAPDQDILERVLEGLPEGWEPASADGDEAELRWRFAVMRDDESGEYRVRDGNGIETNCGADLELAIGLLRLHLRRYVGYHALDLVFVHAGVVAVNGRAIVIPGHSFSGKSTLVAELVRQGAVYYSDEYAVFDEEGQVRPYREPIAMRTPTGLRGEPLTPEQLGGIAGEEHIPVGLVALTTYKPGAQWNPAKLSAAQGLLALLEHAVPVRDRPEQTLGVLRRAVDQAEILQGERGESEEAARSLIERS